MGQGSTQQINDRNKMNWEKLANCRSTDSEIFFAEGKGGYKNSVQLKQICSACQVQTQCLEFALHNAVLGYWGNTTEKERKRIRVRLNIKPKQLVLGEAG